ncbi:MULTISPECIES: TrmH family RNA methyltransferase [Niastella]|uniref:RNA methyltransferase n=1 Tax=Niastella soli TaxID=2821487 RepID=A0ABS3YV95_9BACT|nr:RNA methyltransferase [Niastella soli]MBO9201825.1 RNA methyltransferase [Niastella soli]
MLIKSQVKYIQSLSHKKLRDSEGVFVAEGPKLINELLSARLPLLQLYAVKEWIDVQDKQLAGPVTEITASELERISLLQTPNQVLGIFKKPVFTASRPARNTLSLMLDTIQDPGNLGTIIRCADWFGISQIFCSADCADAYNPKVVQATMGSIARVQVVYGELAAMLKEEPELPTYAAVLNGTDLRQLQPVKEGVIIIGNESKGISPEILALCRNRITIPRHGQAESLNAAVATGIILSHITGNL